MLNTTELLKQSEELIITYGPDTVAANYANEVISFLKEKQTGVKQLESIRELCRLLENQQSDYNDRNYGDAARWDRHIRKQQDTFEENFDKSPWDFMYLYIKQLKNSSTLV